MTNQIALDSIFHALADPTRRAVLQRLVKGPGKMSDLAAPFQMALPTFMQHVKVLEKCGLVRTEKQGRVRICRIETAQLGEAERWIAQRRNEWESQFDRLDRYLTTLTQGEQYDQ